MNWVDIVILAVIALSVIVSLFRGFLREVFSLLVWILAAWLAFRFAAPLAGRMEPWIDLPSARVIIAFAGVFLVVLVIGGLINYLIGKLVASTGLSGTDRMVGALFGAVRGIAIVLVAVVLAGFTPFPQDPWWKASRLLPAFERLAAWAVERAPDNLSGYLPANRGNNEETPMPEAATPVAGPEETT